MEPRGGLEQPLPTVICCIDQGNTSRGGACVDGGFGDQSPRGDVRGVGHAGGGGGRIAPRALRCCRPGERRAAPPPSRPSSDKALGEAL